MNKTRADECRMHAAECLLKAKNSSAAVDWRRMVTDWESLARTHETTPHMGKLPVEMEAEESTSMTM